MTSILQLEFAGHCQKCNGVLYVGLVHSCPTAPKGSSFRPRYHGEQDGGIRESDPNHGGSLIPAQYSNAA